MEEDAAHGIASVRRGGAFRTVFYQVAKRLGRDAAKFLDQVPDDDLRLFATIELAAALVSVPGGSITQMKQTSPVDSSGRRRQPRNV